LVDSFEKFSTWTFLQKYFMVFLNSPYRVSATNVLKIDRWVGGSWIQQMHGGSIVWFWPAPWSQLLFLSLPAQPPETHWHCHCPLLLVIREVDAFEEQKRVEK
jgi:hypothetical protein